TEWESAVEARGVGSGERQKDVAGEVAARGAGSRQAKRHPPSQRLALPWQKRRIGRDDEDHRTGTGWWAQILGEPVAVQRIVVGERGSDVSARNGQFTS